jgi:hypothetical protein
MAFSGGGLALIYFGGRTDAILALHVSLGYSVDDFSELASSSEFAAGDVIRTHFCDNSLSVRSFGKFLDAASLRQPNHRLTTDTP